MWKDSIPAIIRSTRRINNVLTPTIYNVGTFECVGSFLTSGGVASASTDLEVKNYINSYSDGYVLLYKYTLPTDILVSYADEFTITLDLDIAFNDCAYLFTFMGMAFWTSYGQAPNRSQYPMNYLKCSSSNSRFNGMIIPASNPNLSTTYNEFVWKFPGNVIDGGQNVRQLCFLENKLSYNDSSPISLRCTSLTFNASYRAYTLDGINSFFFAIGGPLTSQDAIITDAPETMDDILAVTQEERDLLIQISVALQDDDSLMGQILSALQTLLAALSTGVIYDIDLTLHRMELLLSNLDVGGGASSGLTSSDVRDLFELDLEDQMDIQADWQEMFYEYFPSLYDARDTLEGVYDDLTESSYTPASSVHYNGFSVNNTQIIPAMDVPLKPAGTGWDVFFDTLKVAVNVIITFMFINGLRHRFDKTVLEDDG